MNDAIYLCCLNLAVRYFPVKNGQYLQCLGFWYGCVGSAGLREPSLQHGDADTRGPFTLHRHMHSGLSSGAGKPP